MIVQLRGLRVRVGRPDEDRPAAAAPSAAGPCPCARRGRRDVALGRPQRQQRRLGWLHQGRPAAAAQGRGPAVVGRFPVRPLFFFLLLLFNNNNNTKTTAPQTCSGALRGW